MQTQPTARAIFHERQDAVEAVDRLLDAHVPAADIELTTGDGGEVAIRHRNHMARTALLGGVAGLGMSMLWLVAGASGGIELPVMESIIASVGLVGAGLRLGFLGMAVGVVAGGLGGIRTRVGLVDDRHQLDDAARIIVEVGQDNEAAIDALRDAAPDRLVVFPVVGSA
jgi:hypothetical protein